jgi:hypothetical protein
VVTFLNEVHFFDNDFYCFNSFLFLIIDHYQNLLKLAREYPDEPIVCIWFYIYPALIITKVDYLEVRILSLIELLL